MASEKERIAILETKTTFIQEKVRWLELKITFAGLLGGSVVKYAPDVAQQLLLATKDFLGGLS